MEISTAKDERKNYWFLNISEKKSHSNKIKIVTHIKLKKVTYLDNILLKLLALKKKKTTVSKLLLKERKLKEN